MHWVSLTGLLWAVTAFPVALSISRLLRSSGAASADESCADASWTEDVSQFLREQAVPSIPGQPTTI